MFNPRGVTTRGATMVASLVITFSEMEEEEEEEEEDGRMESSSSSSGTTG
jgi:hypothetical protein